MSEFLKKQPIISLLTHRQLVLNLPTAFPHVVAIDENATLENALALLRDNDLEAIAVTRERKGRGKEEKDYLAFVSVLDILTFVVFKPVFEDLLTPAIDASTSFESHVKVLHDAPAVFDAKVKDLIMCTHESSRLWPFKSSDPIPRLFEVFKWDHRVLVEEETAPDLEGSEGHVTVVSQTDLLRYLIDHREIIGKETFHTPAEVIMMKARKQLGIVIAPTTAPILDEKTGRPKVVAVPQSVSALTAFRIMYIYKVASVGIVDANGMLVGNISASDVRGLRRENLTELLRPVLPYLEWFHALREKAGKKKMGGLITCKPDTPLLNMMQTVLNNRIHRIWVVNERNRPAGVVTMSDMLLPFHDVIGLHDLEE